MGAQERKLMELEVFFDGDCDFCSRQAEKIKAMDAKNHIGFTDISKIPDISLDIEASLLFGITAKELISKPRGLDNFGEQYYGFDLVIKVYEVIGKTKLATFLSLPIVKQLSSLGFYCISKVRRYL